MGEYSRYQIVGILVSVIATIISPSIREIERHGQGVYVALDAVTIETRYYGLFWSTERFSPFVLGDVQESFEFAFPNFTTSPLVMVIWLLGWMAPIAVSLVQRERINMRKGILILAISTISTLLIPGAIFYSIELFYTFERVPIPIPQLAGLLVLLFHNYRNDSSKT